MTVPGGFAGDRLCVLHYTLFVEQECAEMRRESALGKNSHERQNELMGKIADRGEALVQLGLQLGGEVLRSNGRVHMSTYGSTRMFVAEAQSGTWS